MGRLPVIAVAKLDTMLRFVDTRILSAMDVASVGISREHVGVSPKEQAPHTRGRKGEQPAQ